MGDGDSSKQSNATYNMKSNRNSNSDVISPGLAWLTVFVPALSYFLATRFSSLSGGGASLGIPVTVAVDSSQLNSVFYVKQQQQQLQYPLTLIDDSFRDIVASVWKHDAELGRGFLLLSSKNSIWRWERGGGPIPIGKTLAMDPSGCRSKKHCDSGSGGLTVDFHKQHQDFYEGSLAVAEWGEERIVRVQEETGARTPLVINVPDACKHASARPRRVQRVSDMLFTPFGDLVLLEKSSQGCNAIMRLQQAIHVPPLESLMTSRVAHKWNTTHHEHPIDILYRETDIGSMTLDSSGEGLLVTVKQDDGGILLVRLSLVEDEDDEEENESENASMGLLYPTAKVVLNLTQDANLDEPPLAMAVDEKGNVFLAVPEGILVLKDGKHVLGTLDAPTPITSLTLGQDKYLYVTTSTQLLRIRVRHGPPKHPTNLAPKRSTIKT